MAWYWYLSQANEIFLDLDSTRALRRAMNVLRRAMSGRAGVHGAPCVYPFANRLSVDQIWAYPTTTQDHYHMIIALADPLPFHLRVAWSLWMGADRLRAAYVLERYRHGFAEAELLAVRRVYEFRAPDAVCMCPDKHKAKRVTQNCPALKTLLGDHRSADYFPRNRDRVIRGPLRIVWGRISKRSLLRWQ